MIKNLALLALTATLFSGCLFGDKDPDVWTAYLYPDKDNTKRTVIVPVKYPTFETCKEASLDLLKKRGLEDSGTFKCGKNCEYHEGMKIDICEEWKN